MSASKNMYVSVRMLNVFKSFKNKIVFQYTTEKSSAAIGFIMVD